MEGAGVKGKTGFACREFTQCHSGGRFLGLSLALLGLLEDQVKKIDASKCQARED